jgi:HEPN domain-containing protein
MKQKTKTWVTLAENDLSLARDLLKKKGREYYAAHFCHQAIEKMLKAVISEKTDKIPLPTHSFKLLLDQSGLRDIPDKTKEFLFSMTPHYLGTKYPEDIAKLYKSYTKSFVSKLYKNTREGFQWLKMLLK